MRLADRIAVMRMAVSFKAGAPRSFSNPSNVYVAETFSE